MYEVKLVLHTSYYLFYVVVPFWFAEVTELSSFCEVSEDLRDYT